jgi:hypothetical protein
MSGEISVSSGFYFYVKPQQHGNVMSSILEDLVAPYDEDLAEKFLPGVDENSHISEHYASGWFLNSTSFAMYGMRGIGDSDRWADFKVSNGDFTQLQAEYERFVDQQPVKEMKAFLDERYGADAYEIRLGAFAGQSF